MLHVNLAATVRDGADGLLDLGMDPVRASSQPLVPQGHSPPSGRTASDLGVPLRLLGDRQRPLLGAEGASGPIAPIRGLVETPGIGPPSFAPGVPRMPWSGPRFWVESWVGRRTSTQPAIPAELSLETAADLGKHANACHWKPAGGRRQQSVERTLEVYR